MMTLEEFFVRNLWGILVGGVTLTVNAAIFYIVVKQTLAQILAKQASLSKTVYEDVIPEINEIKIKQAERLGYERALKEYNSQGTH